MGISAGSLRDQVQIQAATSSGDGAGGAIKTWSTFATVWAAITPISGGEAFAQGLARNTQFYRVTIRFRSDVSAANRIMWGTLPLNIRSASDPDRRGEALVMTVESGVGEPA